MLSSTLLEGLQSDQLYTWSDAYTDRTRYCTSEASPCPCRSVAPASIDPTWFAYRTIQAMRQARVQMCRWSGAWAQVLSFRELSRSASEDGLCSSGGLQAGLRASRQLSTSQRDSGGDQRDQPRVAASARGALRRHREPADSPPSYPARCGSWRRDSGQYVGRLARRIAEEFILFGGPR
jgi:hypothetical protein